MTDNYQISVALRDAQTLDRALLDYRKLLTHSRYAAIDAEVIDVEVARVDALRETLSVEVFYAGENTHK